MEQRLQNLRGRPIARKRHETGSTDRKRLVVHPFRVSITSGFRVSYKETSHLSLTQKFEAKPISARHHR
jgi:hypothetical protein